MLPYLSFSAARRSINRVAVSNYATFTKRSYTPKSASASSPSSPVAAKRTSAKIFTPTSKTDDNQIPEDVFFDPPEFGLQVGQSQRPSKTTNSGFKSKTLDEIFSATLHDNPEHEQNSCFNEIHWPTSFYGLGTEPFPAQVQEALAQPIEPLDIEIKPDGLIYLPEIKYRRILNKAFGAGAWGLAPRSETIVADSLLTREYALICNGRLVSIARGEQDYFSMDGIPTATEGCRSNALMRCCKDLGIASELWDPNFIRSFKKQYCEEKFVEHATTKRKKKIWKRKDRPVDYPYKVT